MNADNVKAEKNSTTTTVEPTTITSTPQPDTSTTESPTTQSPKPEPVVNYGPLKFELKVKEDIICSIGEFSGVITFNLNNLTNEYTIDNRTVLAQDSSCNDTKVILHFILPINKTTLILELIKDKEQYQLNNINASSDFDTGKLCKFFLLSLL